jgi:hypothetical protein
VVLPVFVFVFLPAPRIHYQISFKAALAVILWDLNFVSLVICFIKRRRNEATYLELIYIYIYIYICVCVCVCVCGGGQTRLKRSSVSVKYSVVPSNYFHTFLTINVSGNMQFQ